MTRIKKGIVLSLACTLIIGLIAGTIVLMIRNSAFNKAQDTSSEMIQKQGDEPNSIGADNKNIATFKNFSEMIETLKAKGYFSNPTGSIRNGTAMYAMDDSAKTAGSTSPANSVEKSTSEYDSSQTNTQVSGVDEGDTVKTDGTYIYALSNNVVRIIDPKVPAEMRLLSSIKLDFNNSSAVEMYVVKDKLVLIGYYYENITKDSTPSQYAYDANNYGTSVKVYSLEDLKNPKLYREYKVTGNLSASRLIEDRLYLITSSAMYNYGDEKNFTPENVLPKYYDSAAGVSGGKFKTVDQNNINYCKTSELSSFLNISTFSVNDTKEAIIETVLGGSGTVYMTTDNLYVGYSVYKNISTPNAAPGAKVAVDSSIAFSGFSDTVILKFTINGLSVKFAAGTDIPGSLLNQFSLDEYKGYLRAATTSYVDNKSQNNVYIYDKELKLTGKLEGLAPGEKIYSVRYSGDTGYVVTYRQVDPLFVIDLSNTSTPKVLGQLKIPGFSNYMHVVGENLVLGIGRDTKETEVAVQKDTVTASGGASTGSSGSGSTSASSPSMTTRVTTGGIKISLFDVSDKANPKELDTVVIGDNSAYCEAQYNHKALLFDSKSSKLYLPFSFVSSDLKTQKTYTGVVIKVSDKKLIEEHYFETERTANSGAGFIEPEYAYNYYTDRFSYIGSTLFQISAGDITSFDRTSYKQLGKLIF